eukprot:TRINITY_DN8725_c0_g1_i1.p1 TRINITY_DN8725_c0_g1~~TRINITY_DN8725_c0_g1_i1.p1  ORF type:complete len:202 (-),score=31.77 TRINITY_DN8725_c0_g1_i1:82-687(-)
MANAVAPAAGSSPAAEPSGGSDKKPSTADLKSAICEYVKSQSGDTDKFSAKALRQTLEAKFKCSLISEKSQIRELTEKVLAEENKSDSESSSDSSSDDSSSGSDSSGPPKKRRAAASKAAPPRKGRKTECLLPRKAFLDAAPDAKVAVQIGGATMNAQTKEFSSGNFGWGVYGKHQMKLGGKDITVQITANLTVVGSKSAS